MPEVGRPPDDRGDGAPYGRDMTEPAATEVPTGRRHRYREGLRRLAFVLVSTSIVTVVSERVFWYWTWDPLAQLEVVLYYAVTVATTLWLIDRYRVRGFAAFALTAFVFGMLVEGVLTPVAYEGIPFVPVLPSFFAGWHGLLALGAAWYLLHRWALERRASQIAMASAIAGALWGAWALTSLLPENLGDAELLADHGTLSVLAPGEFARYAVGYSLLLAAAHWAWGRLGDVSRFEPSVWGERIAAALMAVMVVAYTVAIPWAAPMFVLYVGGAVWLLRRRASATEEPSLLTELSGPVPPTSLLALAPLPVMAAATYALGWWLAPTEATLRIVMWTVVAAATAAGGGAVARAAWTTWRCTRSAPAPAATPVG